MYEFSTDYARIVPEFDVNHGFLRHCDDQGWGKMVLL
jgi:hypothetical protein